MAIFNSYVTNYQRLHPIFEKPIAGVVFHARSRQDRGEAESSWNSEGLGMLGPAVLGCLHADVENHENPRATWRFVQLAMWKSSRNGEVLLNFAARSSLMTRGSLHPFARIELCRSCAKEKEQQLERRTHRIPGCTMVHECPWYTHTVYIYTIIYIYIHIHIHIYIWILWI